MSATTRAATVADTSNAKHDGLTRAAAPSDVDVHSSVQTATRSTMTRRSDSTVANR